MTEKRFIVADCSTCVFDTITEEEYVCIDREEAFLVCNALNNLAYENEELKLLSNHRGEMVSFATSLIQDMGSEEMLKMWNDFREVMYQKWKKRD